MVDIFKRARVHLLPHDEVVSSFAHTHSFISTQLNVSKYCYVIPVIQFLHTVKWLKVLLCNTNNSIQHQSFVCTQLISEKVLLDPQIGFRIRVRVDLGLMAMKELHIPQISKMDFHHLYLAVLSLCRYGVGVYFSCNRLG